MEECLTAYSLDSWSVIKEKFDALPISKSRRMRPLFSNAAKCELDAQGRILLPQKLRDFAGLKKNVTVIGVSNHAEFWDSKRWGALEAEELTPENIAEAMEELGF
jgi:MraZ protein